MAIDAGVALCGVQWCDSWPEWVNVTIRLTDWVEAIFRDLKQALQQSETASQVHECHWGQVFN